jgi:POT family proton-dependent oligopeptide transporter
MLAGLATYVAGWRYLPPDRMRSRSDAARARLTAGDWRIIAALLVVAAIAILPATAYYQETNSGLLFIEASVDRGLFGWTVPTASYISLDGIFCILVVPPLLGLWRWQARRGREPGDIAKIAIGYAITAAANLLMMLPADWAQDGERVSAAWPILLFALNSVGFLFYWPTLLAMFSRAAPAAVNGTMMGLLFFSTFVGNLLVGILGALWERMAHAQFFALHAALAFGPFLLMLLVARPVGRILGPLKD